MIDFAKQDCRGNECCIKSRYSNHLFDFKFRNPNKKKRKKHVRRAQSAAEFDPADLSTALNKRNLFKYFFFHLFLLTLTKLHIRHKTITTMCL